MIANRIGRLELLFWCGAPIVVGSIVLTMTGATDIRVDGSALHGLFLMVILVTSVVILKAAVSRLHDLGWPGWGVVLAFVPLVDIVLFLVLFIAPGQKKPNAYGGPPIFLERWRKSRQPADL